MLKKAANRTQVNCHQTRSKFDHQRHHFEIDSAHKKSPRTVDNLVSVKMLFCWTDCQEKEEYELVLKCRRPWWNLKQSEGNLGKHNFTLLISNLSNIKISCILFHGGKNVKWTEEHTSSIRVFFCRLKICSLSFIFIALYKNKEWQGRASPSVTLKALNFLYLLAWLFSIKINFTVVIAPCGITPLCYFRWVWETEIHFSSKFSIWHNFSQYIWCNM